jgi:hypothetical protein
MRILPFLMSMLAVIVVLAPAGYLQVDPTEVHHVFHIALPSLAFVLFALYVARDVYANGWPTFTWRLTATSSTSWTAERSGRFSVSDAASRTTRLATDAE